MRRSVAALRAAMARSRRGLLVAAVAFGLATGSAMGISVFIVDASVAAGIDPSTAGLLLSVGLTGGSIGGAVGPLVFGFVVEQLGYGGGWLVLSGVGLVAGVVMLAAMQLPHGFDNVASADGA